MQNVDHADVCLVCIIFFIKEFKREKEKKKKNWRWDLFVVGLVTCICGEMD